MIHLHATRELAVRPDKLAALVVDPERWMAFEPRLRSASWLTDPPVRSGSRIELRAHIPYRIAKVRLLLGQPTGVIELLAWEPPSRARLRLETRLAIGAARIDVTAQPGHSVITINGSVRPRSRVASAALIPVRGLVERRATASLERAMDRVGAALG